MTIEEKLKEFILTKYKSLRSFAVAIDMPYSTVDSIFRRGLAKATLTTVLKMCSALGISADELSNEQIVPLTDATANNMVDLETIIQLNKTNMSDQALTIDGKPITAQEYSLIFDTLEIGIELVKRNRQVASDIGD